METLNLYDALLIATARKSKKASLLREQAIKVPAKDSFYKLYAKSLEWTFQNILSQLPDTEDIQDAIRQELIKATNLQDD